MQVLALLSVVDRINILRVTGIQVTIYFFYILYITLLVGSGYTATPNL